MPEVNSADLRGIESALRSLSHEQSATTSAVNQVASKQHRTQQELEGLRAKFEQFFDKNEKDTELQKAISLRGDIRQQITTKFGHYAVVRRHATGILEAVDVGVVTTGTLRSVSEELMLGTPGYWLAPALVALASWIRDDRELSSKALAEALRRDNDKTTLFFSLVLRRFGRVEATTRWLRQYVARQDPAHLSKEFTVVLEAVATGAFGLEARPQISEQMDRWIEQLSRDEAVVTAQVTRWRELMISLTTSAPPSFQVLPAISPTWPKLLDAYRLSTAHGKTHQFLLTLFDGPVEHADAIERRVDDVLDRLVTEYDREEAPLHKEEARQQNVIDNDGDLKAAELATNAQSDALADEVDFLTLLTNAAFYPDKVGASRGTQRLAVAEARDWIHAAANQLAGMARQSMPSAVKISVNGWTGQIDASSTEQSLVTSLRVHCDIQTGREVAAVKLPGQRIFAAVGAGAIVLFAIISMAAGGLGFGVFCLAAAVGLAIYVVLGLMKLPELRDAARQAGNRRREVAVTTLRGAIAEAVDWRSGWNAEIAKSAQLQDFLAGLDPQANLTASPDQSRGSIVHA
jgi:hypothetical protein